MIVSHKHKFIFIHIPKTGGTSICAALEPHIGPKEESIISPIYGLFVGSPIGNLTQHLSVSELCNLYDDDYVSWLMDHYFVFAFVRNPWDRLVSFYHFYQQSESIKQSQPGVWSRTALSFDEWVRSITVGHTENQSQRSYLWCDGRNRAKMVGRFESLESDFNKVLRVLGLHATLNKINASVHRDYRSYYTPDLVAYVAEKFAEDISTFGYAYD